MTSFVSENGLKKRKHDSDVISKSETELTATGESLDAITLECIAATSLSLPAACMAYGIILKKYSR